MKKVLPLSAIVLIVSLLIAPLASGQEAIIVNSSVDGGKALVQFILRKFGSKGAQALEQFGGRAAVKQTIKKAEQEGGDALVKKVTQYGEKYGISGLRAIKQKPSVIVAALDDLPKEQVGKAIGAINRNSKVMPSLIEQFGAKAVKTEIRHPGVGYRFAKILGKDGIEISNKLDTNQAIIIGRHLKEIDNLPLATKTKLLTTLKNTPTKAADFFETHPKITITVASVPVVIYAIHSVTTPVIGIGSDGNPVILKPSELSRFGSWASSIAAKPLSLTLYILGIVLVLFVTGYFAIKIIKQWRKLPQKNYKVK